MGKENHAKKLNDCDVDKLSYSKNYRIAYLIKIKFHVHVCVFEKFCFEKYFVKKYDFLGPENSKFSEMFLR